MNIFGEIGIIKDHLYYRVIKRTRPVTIHTECLHKENVWKAAQEFVSSGRKAIWFVVTPVNFDFISVESGCRMKKSEWENVVLERYKWLQSHGQTIELHVHMRVKMGLYDTESEADEDVESKVNGAYKWLKDNGFSPSKIVFGWWSCNQHAIDVARENGLQTAKRLDNYFIHDYDLL